MVRWEMRAVGKDGGVLAGEVLWSALGAMSLMLPADATPPPCARFRRLSDLADPSPLPFPAASRQRVDRPSNLSPSYSPRTRSTYAATLLKPCICTPKLKSQLRQPVCAQPSSSLLVVVVIVEKNMRVVYTSIALVSHPSFQSTTPATVQYSMYPVRHQAVQMSGTRDTTLSRARLPSTPA